MNLTYIIHLSLPTELNYLIIVVQILFQFLITRLFDLTKKIHQKIKVVPHPTLKKCFYNTTRIPH